MRLALFPNHLSFRRFVPERQAVRAELERTRRLLEEWDLADVRQVAVTTLPYGKQRSLEIVLALAREPALLLLDEPTAGLARAEVASPTSVLHRLPDHVAVVLIDHDMGVVREVARRITVLHRGTVIREDKPDVIFADAEVRKLYINRATARALNHASGRRRPHLLRRKPRPTRAIVSR